MGPVMGADNSGPRVMQWQLFMGEEECSFFPGVGESVMATSYLSHKSCWCPLWSKLLGSVPV